MKTPTDGDARRRSEDLIAGAASSSEASRKAIAGALAGLGLPALIAIEDALWSPRIARWAFAPLFIGAVMTLLGIPYALQSRPMPVEIAMAVAGPVLLVIGLLGLETTRRRAAWQRETLTDAGNRIIESLTPPEGLGAVARGCTMPHFAAAACFKLRDYARLMTVGEARDLDPADIEAVCHLLWQSNIAGACREPLHAVRRAIRILSLSCSAPAVDVLRSVMIPRRTSIYGGSTTSTALARELHKDAIQATRAIESRLAKYEYEQTLLRPSSAEDVETGELLRPAREDEQVPEELLRRIDDDAE